MNWEFFLSLTSASNTSDPRERATPLALAAGRQSWTCAGRDPDDIARAVRTMARMTESSPVTQYTVLPGGQQVAEIVAYDTAVVARPAG
jgi:hypothetical protein